MPVLVLEKLTEGVVLPFKNHNILRMHAHLGVGLLRNDADVDADMLS